ncbi:MotA/TolQ/ExbB proton channel family protein [uncultured Shimia sp.]|uniref:MotA/TolQ/ExbB proton channel family protein n=1 Tax=uncultured Shimia sp. TaxID=573152 RepID=UPI002611B8F6|nr:MotA/TolQ/ExbB proton channel family protein [uncultured Shimia sp.]
MRALSDLGTALPVLLLLGMLSVLSVAIFLARLLKLGVRTKGTEARSGWLRALEKGSIETPPTSHSAADNIAKAAAERLHLGQKGLFVADALHPLAQRDVTRLFSGIRTLELISMIAPLLGLLGTVLGMIQSFRSLELAEGAANASILAGGIWQALLTTAAGLVVAIPALAEAAWLTARAEAETQEIETILAGVRLVPSQKPDPTSSPVHPQ